MADSEFEQFRHYFERLPVHVKATAQTYTLVHDLTPEDSPTSSKSDEQESESQNVYYKRLQDGDSTPAGSRKDFHLEDRDRGLTDKSNNEDWCLTGHPHKSHWPDDIPVTYERRRRKLPDIPTDRKSKLLQPSRQISLAEELGEAMARMGEYEGPSFSLGGPTRPFMVLKGHSYLRDGDSSPDVDSGNSTAHSPDGLKSVSPQLLNDSISPISPDRLATHELEVLDPTHRGLHKFITRHRDEIEIEIGDPVYVQKEAEDLWCEGINLRTGRQGIFPSAYVVDVEYTDFDPNAPKVRRERFTLGYLGSVETLQHKGNSVLCQSVRKIKMKNYTPHSCILEISDTGIRMVDRKKPARKEVPCHDYFYSLKNVSFCAFHPRDQHYMGFITKHPHCDRFACHVFVGNDSTRPVAEAVGRAFDRFYQKFIETAYPVEDIYIE